MIIQYGSHSYKDIKAIKKNDPTAKSLIKNLMFYTTLQRDSYSQFSYVLYTKLRIPVLPHLVSMSMRFWSGIEILPCAMIDKGLIVY